MGGKAMKSGCKFNLKWKMEITGKFLEKNGRKLQFTIRKWAFLQEHKSRVKYGIGLKQEKT